MSLLCNLCTEPLTAHCAADCGWYTCGTKTCDAATYDVVHEVLIHRDGRVETTAE